MLIFTSPANNNYRNLRFLFSIFFAIILVQSVIAQQANPLDPEIENQIITGLSMPGEYGDRLRTFHNCVVSAALKGKQFQGVIGVMSSGGACENQANAFWQKCLTTHKNQDICGFVTMSTSLYSETYAKNRR